MFETMIAFCMVLATEGQPVSPCWMNKENRIFPSLAACKTYAELREAEVMTSIVNEYDVAPVVSVVCGPVGKAS